MVKLILSLVLAVLALTGGWGLGLGKGQAAKNRRRRVRAMGKWPAIVVGGLLWGAPMFAFFTVLSWAMDFTAGMGAGQELVLTLVTAVICLGGGLVFGWFMWLAVEGEES